jgi:ketosteroid isomerase-like protein
MTTTNINMLRLTAAVRDLADSTQHRDAATYAAMLADLARAWDEVQKHTKGTPENLRAFAATRPLWDAARKFAAKRDFQHPTDALQEMGYNT